MDSSSYEKMSEELKALDEATIDRIDGMLGRILNKIKNDDPERYEAAIKTAEDELRGNNGNNGNGGKDVGASGRGNKETGCT